MKSLNGPPGVTSKASSFKEEEQSYFLLGSDSTTLTEENFLLLESIRLRNAQSFKFQNILKSQFTECGCACVCAH